MAENPNITTFEMANKLNMSRSGITKQIAILQEQNIICRVGPDKGGHWEIVEK
ncbi:HTH domain-containing protein [bacterium]|nr:HTH domain-containing protein [bacterium]